MTTLREAAQQALEALERPNAGLVPHNGEWMSIQSIAIDALRVALAEPVQEQPVCDECGKSKRDGWALYCVDCLEPMFAQRKPLTEDEIALIVADCSASAHRHDDFSFARAIERAHGI